VVHSIRPSNVFDLEYPIRKELPHPSSHRPAMRRRSFHGRRPRQQDRLLIDHAPAGMIEPWSHCAIVVGFEVRHQLTN
jgi:hypothetical protein